MSLRCSDAPPAPALQNESSWPARLCLQAWFVSLKMARRARLFCRNAPGGFVLTLLRCWGGCEGEWSVDGWRRRWHIPCSGSTFPEPLLGLCYRRQAPAFCFGCSRNMVHHLARQSRKAETWVLLRGPWISRFGKLDELSRQRPSRGRAVAH